MGRYLALGVASSVMLRRKKNYWGDKSDFDFQKNETKVKKGLSTLLDITKYSIAVDQEGMDLEMKPECFSSTIHDLIKELYPLIDCRSALELNEIEFNENFNQENYPLTIKKSEKSDAYHTKGYFYLESNDFSEWPDGFCVPEVWLFDDEELVKNIHVTMAYILLWADFSKFSSKDETELLKIMNRMSRKYFHSSLSKNMFFFIFG